MPPAPDPPLRSDFASATARTDKGSPAAAAPALRTTGGRVGPPSEALLHLLTGHGAKKARRSSMDLGMMNFSSEAGCPTDGGSRSNRYNQYEQPKDRCQAASASLDDEQCDGDACR